mmetsp:Transcript_66388/g.216002  ORF Transcript_66388/g.216002 Transcript_66388/m.216002 type:complete len:206 (+) Transcript_66388:1064-1681(+)
MATVAVQGREDGFNPRCVYVIVQHTASELQHVQNLSWATCHHIRPDRASVFRDKSAIRTCRFPMVIENHIKVCGTTHRDVPQNRNSSAALGRHNQLIRLRVQKRCCMDEPIREHAYILFVRRDQHDTFSGVWLAIRGHLVRTFGNRCRPRRGRGVRGNCRRRHRTEARCCNVDVVATRVDVLTSLHNNIGCLLCFLMDGQGNTAS